MIQEPSDLNWSASSIVEDYTEFSREFFWSSYQWQAAVGLQRSGLTKRGGKILDIGCGPGWMTFILKERSPSSACFGVDLSTEMVEQARVYAQQQQLQDVHFTVSDVLHLPFEDNLFDLVISSSSFRLWGDQLRGLQEAYRVLRPGGLLFISDIGGDMPKERQQMLIENTPPTGRTFVIPALETAFPSAKVEDILRQSNLPDWECRVGGLCGLSPTDREVMDWLVDGFPLRDLQKSFQGKAWARELRQYWICVYLRKPKEE